MLSLIAKSFQTTSQQNKPACSRNIAEPNITRHQSSYTVRTMIIASLVTLTLGCSHSNGVSLLESGNVLTPRASEVPLALTSQQVMAQMEKVANWQVPRIDSLNYLQFKRGESLEAGRWVQGAFYIGLTELAERSTNPFYQKWIALKGNELDWQIGPIHYFGDDQLIAQTYLWYYLNHQQDKKMLQPTISAFNQVLTEHKDISLEFKVGLNAQRLHQCQRRWCWADALFMAPASWFGLSKVTDDQRYAEHAHKEVKATVDYLFDPNYNLLYRDSRFKNKKDQFGNQVFWARGSGWVFAGLARMMEYIDKADPNRVFYEELFKKMAGKLKSLQKSDGSWAMSLLAKEDMPQPETSGTAFFTYGLAWGINNGLLSEQDFLPTVTKGWTLLNSAVHPDGKLGWVQQIGAAPGTVSYEDSQIYAVGAYLLAGAEIYDFLQLKNN